MAHIEDVRQFVEILDKLRNNFGHGRSLDLVIPNQSRYVAAEVTINLLDSLRELAQFCREKPEEVPALQKQKMNILVKTINELGVLNHIRRVRGEDVVNAIEQAAKELGKTVSELRIEKLDQVVEILDEFDRIFPDGVILHRVIPNSVFEPTINLLDSLKELATFCREKPNEVPVAQKRRMNNLVQDVNKALRHIGHAGYPQVVYDIRQAAAELKVAAGNVPGRRPAAPVVEDENKAEPEDKGGRRPPRA